MTLTEISNSLTPENKKHNSSRTSEDQKTAICASYAS